MYQEIDSERPHMCVLCLAGVSGGTYGVSGGHHHIVSRSRLPGEKNWDKLWAKSNIAISCMKHHEMYGHGYEALWQKAMVDLGFSDESDYR